MELWLYSSEPERTWSNVSLIWAICEELIGRDDKVYLLLSGSCCILLILSWLWSSTLYYSFFIMLSIILNTWAHPVVQLQMSSHPSQNVLYGALLCSAWRTCIVKNDLNHSFSISLAGNIWAQLYSSVIIGFHLDPSLRRSRTMRESLSLLSTLFETEILIWAQSWA